MSSKTFKFFTVIALSILFSIPAIAETYQLGPGMDFAALADSAQSQQTIAVSQFKQLVSNGKTGQAKKAAEQLKNDFPTLTDEGFDDFVKAELLLANHNYTKAIREYDNFLDNWPNSILYEAAVERQYDIATAFLHGQKIRRLKILKLKAYEEGTAVMQSIADRTGDAPIAKRALTTLAISNEKRYEFIEAYNAWSEISGRWPTGKTGQESQLGMARSLHSSYTGPKFSAGNLNSAKSYYNNFRLRYPGQAEPANINSHLALLEQQKAYKEFEVANYYNRTDAPTPASLYYRSVIDTWPKSSAAQLAKKEMRKIETGQKEKRKKGLFDWWFYPSEDKIALFGL